ncbi:T6SS effector BTH_I2691 family protein [Vibrio spartinae]|uniref:Toxin VasX N-terminal region domain-containing protein n=1 Tax=Vibrio spartinae TaxID=1918945 RepID=A0ABX6QV26_9VIBR|nr:T6SS effector BTH_I2691 family protein [Vibrio spartinae]QMV12835.1 hypothetical protein Vspart_00027 [Vibrio spartinae]
MSNPNDVQGSRKPMNNPVGECPVKSSVMSIVPVRYALDDLEPVEYHAFLKRQLNPLPKEEHWQGPLKLKEAQYTLRQLRDGWLYVYDETDKTFHEYQVSGSELIKIDWGSNEAESDTDKRGSAGKSQPFLEYPSQNKLYMAFSYHRWSWRVCEHMRSDSSSRHKWMRQVNLKQFCQTMKVPHCSFIDTLSEQVADIYDGEAPSDDLFGETCTPLKKPKQQPDNDFPYALVAEKPATDKGSLLKGMKSPSTAMYVALDDVLADITDLVMGLSYAKVEKEATLGDKENIHKMRMAEIVRQLGRVSVPKDKMDKQIRDDITHVLACEELLNQYLLMSSLAEEDKRRLESPGYDPQEGDMPASGAAEAAEKMKATLKDSYGLTVTPEMHEQWSRAKTYQKDVDWDGMTTYLTEQYHALKGLDEVIAARYDEVLLGINALEDNALSVGIDTQAATDVSYLLDLTGQSLVVLKNSVTDEKRHRQLEKTFSVVSPKNLFALAGYGFSQETRQTIDEQIQTLHKQLLSVGSAGDNLALAAALANWDALIGDGRIQDKSWYLTLVQPVKDSFSALAKAVQTTSAHSWRSILDLTRPSYSNPESLIDHLRMLLMGAIVDEKAVLQVNRNYVKEMEALGKQLKPLLKGMSNLTHPETGAIVQVNKYKKIQAEIDRIIVKKQPQLLRVKGDALNEKLQQTLTEYVEKLRGGGSRVGQALKSSVEEVGGLGGLLVGLGVWNTFVVLMNLPEKLKDAETDEEKYKTLLEPLYSALYTCQFAYAVSLSPVWKKISANQSLMRTSVNRVLAKKAFSVESQVLVSRFSNLMLTTASLGALASGLEAWDSYNKTSGKDNTLLETAGYWLKFGATLGNTGIFGYQLIVHIASRMGSSVAIGATLAPWMLTGLFWMGMIYLVGVVLINLFKRDDVSLFLYHSVWGKNSSGWSLQEELTQFEQLMYRPVVRLVKINAPEQRYTSIYAPKHQWQVEIDLPPLVNKGDTLGLQMTRTPMSSGVTNMAGSPVLINEQNGQWQRIEKDQRSLLRYSAAAGGSDNDMIALLLQMPLYLWPATQKEAPEASCHLLYSTYGYNEGVMNLQVVDAETNTKSTRSVVVTV